MKKRLQVLHSSVRWSTAIKQTLPKIFWFLLGDFLQSVNFAQLFVEDEIRKRNQQDFHQNKHKKQHTIFLYSKFCCIIIFA